MTKSFNGELSDFTFWQDDEQIKPDKYGDMIVNAFSFDLTDKKIVTLLYKKLHNNYNESDLIPQLNKINANIGFFLQELFQTVDFALDYAELTPDDVFKICSVKPSIVYDSFLEKIICYINILVELKNTRFFVFVGLKDVLNDDDLKLLYNHCALKKVCLLLVESSKKRPLLSFERAIIITDDLCEIVENYD